MRLLTLILSVALLVVIAVSSPRHFHLSPTIEKKSFDPAGYTAGTFVNWSFTTGGFTHDHGFGKSTGFDAAPDSLQRVLIHFAGDGETSSAQQHTQSIGKVLEDAGINWNMQVQRADGLTVHYCVFVIYNTNNLFVTPYVNEIEYFFANTSNLPDTSDHRCYIMTHFSGGPQRGYVTMLDSDFDYSNVFGFVGSVSPTPFSIGSGGPYNVGPLTANKNVIVWRNGDDANGGTPEYAADGLYNDLTGIRHLRKPASAGGHSADSFFSVYGTGNNALTDSNKNRFRFWAEAVLPSAPSGPPPTPSTNLIDITKRNVRHFNNAPGKTAQRLFDNDVNTNLDKSGVNDGYLSIPFEAWIVLDSFYHNMKLEYYDIAGGSNLTIDYYTERPESPVVNSGDSLGTFTFQTNTFNTWRIETASSVSLDSVRFIRIRATDFTAFTQSISELKLYGDAQGPAPSTWRSTLRPYNDIGRFGFGIGQLGNLDMNYVSLTANNIRIILPAAEVNNPGDYSLPLSQFGMRLDNDGVADAFNASYMNYARANNMRVTISPTGGNIKYLTSGEAATYNYSTWVNATFYKKYIVPGSDSTVAANYDGLGHLFNMFAFLYRDNTSSVRSYNIFGGLTTQGQNGLDVIANNNEYIRDWQGTQGHSKVPAFYASQKAVYDSIKAFDINTPVFMGALIALDEDAVEGLNLYHYFLTKNTTPFPADGGDLNQYMNGQYGGQQFVNGDSAVTPERFRLYERFVEWKGLNDSCFGRIRWRWTECGFGIDNTGPFHAYDVPGKTREQTKGDWAVRNYGIAMAVPQCMEAYFYYWFSSDGTYVFGDMAVADPQFTGPGGSYSGTILRPAGWVLNQQKTIEEGYNFWRDSDGLIATGDSTGVWCIKKTLPSNSNKKLFRVWKGSDKGQTQSYTLNLGAGVTSAVLKEYVYISGAYTTNSLTITGNSVNLTASEKTIWVEATYNESVTNNNQLRLNGIGGFKQQ